jgi:hypothetical protein
MPRSWQKRGNQTTSSYINLTVVVMLHILYQTLGNVSKGTERIQPHNALMEWDTSDSKVIGYELDDRSSAPSSSSIFLTASTNRPAVVTLIILSNGNR